MKSRYVLNKYNDTMYKIGDCVIAFGNPMYVTFDSFDKMKSCLCGRKQDEIKRVRKALQNLEEEFLSIVHTEEFELTEFTRDGK